MILDNLIRLKSFDSEKLWKFNALVIHKNSLSNLKLVEILKQFRNSKKQNSQSKVSKDSVIFQKLKTESKI